MDQLINKISAVSLTLKSKEVIDYLNQWNIDKMHLLKLVIESKLGFDQLSAEPENASYFAEIEESSIYSTSNYSELIMIISTLGDTSKNNFQNNNLLNRFYLFHKMLYRTAKLVSNLLANHLEASETRQMGEALPSQTIVNPLFVSKASSVNSTSIPNPLGNQSEIKRTVVFSAGTEAANLDNKINPFSVALSVKPEVQVDPPVIKEVSKLFSIKEKITVSPVSPAKETQQGASSIEEDSENEVSLGAFLKTLSGF